MSDDKSEPKPIKDAKLQDVQGGITLDNGIKQSSNITLDNGIKRSGNITLDNGIKFKAKTDT